MNIKGYIGSPLHDSKGKVIGITVALSEKPIENEDMIITLFEIFSGRIAVEIERVEQDIEILRLTQVVNQNPFSTILTNQEGIIQYVNKQTVVMTGYEENELIGKPMNILSSKFHSKDFFVDLWDTILNKRKMWRGTIINKIKNGKHLDCSSSIFPLFDEQNEITNFVTIQEDITELKIKDKLFLMQTRQAQMGEMLAMIAHQWRQPLSSISASAIDMQIKIDLEKIQLKDEDKQYIFNSLSEITGFIQNLSATIDDFRNFYKPNKQSDNVKLEEVCKKSLAIIKNSLLNNNINIVEDYHSNDTLEIYTNEIIQVVLNILKNVEDNFLEKNIKDPSVKISTNNKTLCICDNGGGIPEDILPKIFDPYFSTKDEKNGTGLGLYMSKIIIEAHHNATLTAVNTVDGICFKIEFKD